MYAFVLNVSQPEPIGKGKLIQFVYPNIRFGSDIYHKFNEAKGLDVHLSNKQQSFAFAM